MKTSMVAWNTLPEATVSTLMISTFRSLVSVYLLYSAWWWLPLSLWLTAQVSGSTAVDS
jgi:hypothetical protein